ncbi:hypothetical protein B835_1421 [Enterococcus mundtii 3F]|uniref:hypothetical protein n=1 Tax=Enterococcus mundtii TaxID=53346 RepID=UPI0023044D4D|nr:hypothetical protein [Enterococcus mundtii]MDA9461522.1 hypothetical protein [Enterococcus mundtii 3F]
MSDLENTNNIYANFAQRSYTGREINFPYEELSFSKKKKLDNNNSVKFNFPNPKDAHGNDLSTVYLQPDTTVKTVKELGNIRVPKVNGG